jgi:restriction endonuclease S subunit
MRDGWDEITLDELVVTGVVSLGRGNVISKKDMEVDPGPYPVYSSAQNNDGRIGSYNKFMFDEELITWSVDGGGYVFYRPHHKFSVTNIGGYLRILDTTKFLYPFLAAVLQKLHGQHVFDWQNKAHPSVIRKLYNNIPLASLDEQKRIVDVMSSVDAYIDALQQQADSARTARNAVLHELLSVGGDDWTETTLGEVSVVSYGYTDSASTEIVGPKFLRITDIQNSGVDWDSVPYCRIDEKQLQKQRLEDGDIVFARTGATTGKSFLVLNPPNAVCASYLIRLRPDSVKVIPYFLNLNFQTESYWGQVKSGTTGSAQGGFNASKLASLSLHLPELDEQKRIVEIVSSMDEVIQSTEQAVVDARNLRSGLLSDLLSGEHEIPRSYDTFVGAA